MIDVHRYFAKYQYTVLINITIKSNIIHYYIILKRNAVVMSYEYMIHHWKYFMIIKTEMCTCH